MLGDNEDIVVTVLRSQLAIVRAVRSVANKEGLSMQQFGVLRLLALKGPIAMNILGEELKVSPPVITGIVDRLEGKRFVQRRASTADRRRTEIWLLKDGMGVYRRIQTGYRRLLHESLESSLSPREQDQLANLLGRFGTVVLQKVTDKQNG
jgi:DNA-binding MarR family transcriptional regulator